MPPPPPPPPQVHCYKYQEKEGADEPVEELGDMVQMWLESYNTYHLVDGFAMREAWGAIMPHIMLGEKNLQAILDQVRVMLRLRVRVRVRVWVRVRVGIRVMQAILDQVRVVRATACRRPRGKG